MSISPGPTGCWKGWSRSAMARSTVRASVVDPQSQGADGGSVRDVEGMREAFLVSIHDDVDVALPPAGHSLRAMDAGLLKSEPAQGFFEAAGAPRSSTANSTNSMPEQAALGGRAGRSGRAAPVRRRSSSSMTISERCPSMATLRAEPARKRSLNISRESRPSNPVAWSASMKSSMGKVALARESSGSAGSRIDNPCRASAHRPSARGRYGRPGMERIAERSVPRASTWKESSTSPTAGWFARRTTSHESR